MLSACLEYEDILSDKLRGAHPSPFFDKRSDFVDYPSKARLPVAFPKGRGPDTHPQPTPQGRGARDKHLHVQADMLSACMEYEDLQSAII